MILIDLAQRQENKTISVVSESLPHLKRGAIKDFLSIMESHGYYVEDRWNRTNFTYEFETGTNLEFFSADSSDKVRGPRRDYLFINEANRLSYETYRQLALRTNEDIWIDYNPSSAFYGTDILANREDADHIIVTYKDNEALPQSIVDEIESYKSDSNFWKVYGLGQLGSNLGQIYTNWTIRDGIPAEAEIVRYGLDFGYTHDPSAIVAIYKYNDWFILDEVVYAKGLSNKILSDHILECEQALTVADSAEPKSIDEIKSYGVSIIGSKKGKDSVLNGIQTVQQQKFEVTKHSTNLIKELRNYSWKTNRDGDAINAPEHQWSHAMDGLRYALTDLLGNVNNLSNRVDFMI